MGWQRVFRLIQDDPGEYIVQTGMFAVKSNAEKKVSQLKAHGFDAIVKTVGNQYRVQAGVFRLKANAKKLVKQLKASGFDAIIK